MESLNNFLKKIKGYLGSYYFKYYCGAAQLGIVRQVPGELPNLFNQIYYRSLEKAIYAPQPGKIAL